MEETILLDVQDREKLIVKESTLQKHGITYDGLKFLVLSSKEYSKIIEEALSIFKSGGITAYCKVEIRD